MIAAKQPNYRTAKFPGNYSPAGTAGDCWFDATAGAHAVAFFPRFLTFLAHFDPAKAGTPFTLERWQANIVANLFGWKRKDGTRRYRTAFVEIPRKAGKSSFAAGLGLYTLLCENEGDNQVYGCAASSEQAAIVFSDAKQHTLRNAALAKRLLPKFNSLEYKDESGRLIGRWKVLSSDGGLQHGLRPNVILADELHEWKGRELWDAMQTGRGNRRQPLTVAITTAGFDRTSICYEQYSYACQVRDGIIKDESFLPVIYEAGPEDDWTSPKTWRKAQPNLGVSVPESYYAEECQRAQNLSSYENAFKRLYLNIWTEQENRWLSMTDWDSCSGAVDIEQLRGLPCYVGLDFGWRDDYAACVAVVVGANGVFYVLPQFWLPQEGRRDKRAEPTLQFVQRKLVQLTNGNATDIGEIYRHVDELAATFDLREICLDPNNARAQGQHFQEQGHEVFEFQQSKKFYNEPCRFLESLLKEKRIAHGGNAVLRWMASNAAAESDGLGQMMPKKKRSNEKIDGICAMTMGLARAMLYKETSVSGSLFLV